MLGQRNGMRTTICQPYPRRQFFKLWLLGGVGTLVTMNATRSLARNSAGKFFTVKQHNGRWWFITPNGKPFFSLGLNHIDSSPLRYKPTENLWEKKYANSMECWLKTSVAPNLRVWGFNSIGWTQEVVVRGEKIHRHSPGFTYEEYQWLGMPYCHLLPFAEIHQWDAEVRHPDFYSKDFEDWCDYVARSQCARFAGDEKLIGYFFSDCPCWVHTRPWNAWKGPLFDPDKLKTAEGRAQLFKLATRYYLTIHTAIRRYDKYHLILGDRYEAMATVPDDVLLAARPFVDVFSFQHFGPVDRIRSDLTRFAQVTAKPVLLADSAGSIKKPDGTLGNDPVKYHQTMSALREIPACVGFHLCGAYLRNRARNRGLLDENEQPDTEAIQAITRANREMADWVKRASGKAQAVKQGS